MRAPIVLAVLAIAAGVTVGPAAFAPASAQFAPNSALGDRDHDGVPNVFDPTNNNRRPQAWGDKDHDGIPNAYDNHNNRQQAWDKDHDGVPNRYDRYNNNKLQRDTDHDGVPNAVDRNPRNPYR